MANRSGARFCRRCGSALATVSFVPGPLRASGVDLLSIPGSFRRPPLAINGLLYALATDGVLHQLSPRSGARSTEAGRFGERGVGFNRGAAVHIEGPGCTSRGWNYVGITTDGVVAMSLATSRTEVLYRPAAGQEISANRTEADATGCRGVVATEELCAFAVRTPDDEFLLTLKPFAKDRPVLQPLSIHGGRVAGPALCDGTLVLCSDEEMGSYDLTTQREAKMALPSGFVPLLRPSSPDLSIAPGSLPVAGGRERDGSLTASVAGLQDGVAGILAANLTRGTAVFLRRPVGSSIFTNLDGSMTVATLDTMERRGRESSSRSVGRMQPGMPAFGDEPMSCWFAEQMYPGKHRVMLAMDGQTIELGFEDARCTPDACCGIYLVGRDLLVSFLGNPERDHGVGLWLAHWKLL